MRSDLPQHSLPDTDSAHLRRILAALITALLVCAPALLPSTAFQLTAAAAPTDDQLGADGSVLRDATTERVAPGLDLTNFSRLEDKGWTNANVLTADLTTPSLSMDVANPGDVTSRAKVTELMSEDTAVAAVNGSFFDINYSDAPIYSVVGQDGMQVGTSQPKPALTIDGVTAAIRELSVTGTAEFGGKAHELAGLNNPDLDPDSIGVYTSQWGDYTLDRPVGGPNAVAEQVARATIVDSEVVEASGLTDTAGEMDAPEGGQVLLGRDAGAEAVAELEVGDTVTIDVGPAVDGAPGSLDLGLAGSDQILTDGTVPDLPHALATAEHPRTAVGISKDGSELFVLTVDGRSAESRGMTLMETGQLLADMGAHNALNLDGGGSTTMAARAAGTERPIVHNNPSDGEEREVVNALVFHSSAPREQLSDVQIDTALDDAGAVLTGTQRTLTGTGLGANLEPITTDGEFSASGSVTLTESTGDQAVVTGDARGRADVTYAAGPHTAAQQLRVLGEPAGLIVSERAINLTEDQPQGVVTVSGFDADGHSAPIETADTEVTAPDGITVEPAGLAELAITAEAGAASGPVEITVGEVSTQVAVTVGTEEQTVIDLGDETLFTDDAARAAGSFGSAEGREEGTRGMRLQYDFTTSTATRGYYLVAKEPVEIDGTTLAFEMDVKGDATGAWPRLQVTAADGTVTNLDGEHITFDDWKRIRFSVPEGLAQPLSFGRIRMMETRPGESYSGDITVADLTAVVAPPADAAPNAVVHDPGLLAYGDTTERPQQIAVMSDSQFVAADPDSQNAQGARRTLKEIRESGPDLLVINGDFVDEASPEDFELAQTILDEEWDPAIPYVYVPGNHEVMGGEIANFEEAFGATQTERTLGRTKLLTYNTATGSLKDAGLNQLQSLESSLDELSESDDLTGAVLFFHHPPQDPLPTQNSKLNDPREAKELERLLGEFRSETGKSVAVVNAHVGVFHGSAVDGVSYLINGNSGKSPAGAPGQGGFTGWTMLGVQPGKGQLGENPSPADRAAWMAAETRPWVDEISVEGPTAMVPGQTDQVSASFDQDGRTLDVKWPVTSQWGGANVVVDTGDAPAAADADGAAAGDPVEAAAEVVRVNPRTGELTALAPGTAELNVTVNGRVGTLEITVAGDEDEQPSPDPTEEPTDGPTDTPSDEPSEQPSEDPSEDPSETPSEEPTDGPFEDPSEEPGDDPTGPEDERDDSERDDESGRDEDSERDDDAQSKDRKDRHGGPLPRTGAQLIGYAGLAALLIGAGGVAVGLSRRRR